jgi:hypothetical protein
MKLFPEKTDTLIIHQSDIKHFVTCPDQFRASKNVQPGGDFDRDLEIRVETDAATVGTVFHTVVEHELLGNRFQRLADAERFARHEMVRLVDQYVAAGVEYRTESFGENGGAVKTLEKLVGQWFGSEERKYWLALVKDHPNCIQVEHQFLVPFITNREGRYKNVMLAGTMDVLDTYNHRIVDWKTSSRRYERWEKQRWDVQSTVYTFAAAQQNVLDRHEDGYHFQFKVFNHKYNDPEPQTVEVQRDIGQWGWLVQTVSHMIDLIESDLPRWPLRDDHALCGPRWCPVWNECKGMYVTHPEWK